MERVVLRALLAAIGAVVLAVYVGAGVLLYLLLAAVWADPSSRLTALAIITVGTVLVGLLSYRYGTQQLLFSLDARELPRRRAPGLHDSIDRLADRAAVDRPAVYVADLDGPNALAVGGVNAGALVLDPSLFRLLDRTELEAIVAHEIAHLENNDGLIQTLAYSCLQTAASVVLLLLFPLVLVVTGVARGIAWMRGTPGGWPATSLRSIYYRIGMLVSVVLLALTMLVRAHSRRREFAADDRAVELTGNPMALASALARIDAAAEYHRRLHSPLYIVEDEDDPLFRWFSTHPPVEQRIERLRARAATADQKRLVRIRRAQ